VNFADSTGVFISIGLKSGNFSTIHPANVLILRRFKPLLADIAQSSKLAS
jgi:hypothetical protein